MSPATSFPLHGRPIHRIGFGAMQLPGPGVWGPPTDHDAAIAVLRRAVELGVDHIDTAQYYGPDVANDLIREALHPYPDGLRLVTKLGARREADRSWQPALRPEELRAGLDDNLQSLGVERMDMVNLRLLEGAGIPFAESLGALAELRDEGKLDVIGLSNVSLADLEAGMALTDIGGVQNLYNLFDRSAQPLLDACAGHGLAFTPFFPLGSAFTGGPARLASEPAVRSVAERHDATPAQVALAWLLHQGDHVLLIPGTSSIAHLEENMGAANVALAADDLAALDALATPAAARADR